MPDHKVHRLIDRIFLGKEFKDVHRWMDKPYAYLGPKHRILRHDPFTVLLKYHDDPARLASALLHIIADEVISCSKSKKFLRKRDSRRKRRRRK